MQELIVSVSFGTHALCKWKGKSCSGGDASSCCLGHGDTLVIDGQCQDEFLHCTDPGLDQDRINVTFRWIRQHAACCLWRAVCRRVRRVGSSVAVAEFVGNGAIWAFWVLLGALCMWESTSSASSPLHVYRTRVTQVCLSLDMPIGRRSVGGHHLRDPRG